MTLNDLLTSLLTARGLKSAKHINYVMWFKPTATTEWICDVYVDHVCIRGAPPLYAIDPNFIEKINNALNKIL
jgi:hypothetical protein